MNSDSAWPFPVEYIVELNEISNVSCHSTGKDESMLSENQRKLFADFDNSVEAEGILDEKASHLIKIAAAMAFCCYP